MTLVCDFCRKTIFFDKEDTGGHKHPDHFDTVLLFKGKRMGIALDTGPVKCSDCEETT